MPFKYVFRILFYSMYIRDKYIALYPIRNSYHTHKHECFDHRIFAIHHYHSHEYLSVIRRVTDDIASKLPTNFPIGSILVTGGRRDRMVVGFMTTYAISVYHH
jgi:hypothetical protein